MRFGVSGASAGRGAGPLRRSCDATTTAGGAGDPGSGPRPGSHGRSRGRVRRAHRPEWRGQPPADDHVRRLPRRRRALRHRLRVRRWRRRVRLASRRCPASRRTSSGAATGPSSGSSARPSRRPRRVRRPPQPAAAGAEVLLQSRIDALDITVLKGGGDDVGAVGQGPRLPPAARRARGARLLRRSAARSSWPRASTPMPRPRAARPIGDGTPVHITIPTPNPWVPLRILCLGKAGRRAGRGRRLSPDRRARRRSCRRRRAGA